MSQPSKPMPDLGPDAAATAAEHPNTLNGATESRRTFLFVSVESILRKELRKGPWVEYTGKVSRRSRRIAKIVLPGKDGKPRVYVGHLRPDQYSTGEQQIWLIGRPGDSYLAMSLDRGRYVFQATKPFFNGDWPWWNW